MVERRISERTLLDSVLLGEQVEEFLTPFSVEARLKVVRGLRSERRMESMRNVLR